jgi:hypothetical protein
VKKPPIGKIEDISPPRRNAHGGFVATALTAGKGARRMVNAA